MDTKTIANSLRQPLLKTTKNERDERRIKYSFKESNEAYKLNVTHLQKIRDYLSNSTNG